MENLKWTGWIIAFILLIVVIFQRSCVQPPTVIVEPPEIVYVYDTIPKIIIQKETELRIDTIIVTEYLPHNIDTLAILADYFSKVKYFDVLLDDSSAFIALAETVYKNRITERELTFINRQPVKAYIKEPYPVPVPITTPRIFVGGELSTGMYGQGVALGFGYTDNKKGLITYHYDLIHKEHRIGYHIELRNFKLFYAN